MNETVLKLDNVNLTLGDGASEVKVLDKVAFSVARGASLGIVGPSGSGKTSLLMVLSGLERADSGSIEIAGTQLTSMSEDALASFRGRSIGIVFQSFHLIPNMTALENVAVPLELAGHPRAFERAKEELVKVGLGERLTHFPGQLSGGEQQRVAIARALAPEPQMLVADEPTGNLDLATGGHIADLLFGACRDRGMTMLLVTHDPQLAARCDRQIRMRAGQVIDDSLVEVAGQI
ncbi:MAG: ABC transporter ATP-binding protein [Rhizobiaceae bacterium]